MFNFGPSPKLLARDPSAFGHGLQLCPHDRGMNAPVELLLGEAAIGAGDDVLAPDEPGEPEEAVGHELWMLHDVRAVAYDAWGQYLAFGQLDVFPDSPFVFVAGIGGLDEVGASTDLENEIHDLPQRNIRRVRSW